jgi:hypothetical protein
MDTQREVKHMSIGSQEPFLLTLRSVFAMPTGAIIMFSVAIILDILGITLLLLQTFDKI